MVVGFGFTGVWCYSEWWVWDLITLAVSGKWKISMVIPRLYGWVYKTLKLSPILVEQNVAVMSVSLNLWVANFWFPFYEICVQNQWGIKFWDPVEHSNTSSLSSITVRME